MMLPRANPVQLRPPPGSYDCGGRNKMRWSVCVCTYGVVDWGMGMVEQHVNLESLRITGFCEWWSCCI